MQESKKRMGHNERCKIYEFDVPEREEKKVRLKIILKEILTEKFPKFVES